MANLHYFAYGSNMCTPRLRFRVPSCRFLTTAKLPGHQLRFHKSGKDGSAKCDAFWTDVPGDVVWGAVFEIPESEKPRLDRAEGLGYGYNAKDASLALPNGSPLVAMTYVADPRHVRADLVPFTWYWDFVSRGAAEHRLPADYVASFIANVRTLEDPDAGRDRLSRAEVKP